MKTDDGLRRLATVAAIVLAGLAVSAGAANAAVSPQAAPAVYITSTVTVSEGGSQYSIMQMSGVLKPGLSAPVKSSRPVSPMTSINQCSDNSSLSVSVCGWIYYSWTTNSEGTGYAELTSVKNEGIRHDSQVVLSSLKFTPAANGLCLTGCLGQPNHHPNLSIPGPASSTVYTWSNTLWSGYQRVSNLFLNWCRLDQDLAWQRGSATYHLKQTLKVADGT